MGGVASADSKNTATAARRLEGRSGQIETLDEAMTTLDSLARSTPDENLAREASARLGELADQVNDHLHLRPHGTHIRHAHYLADAVLSVYAEDAASEAADRDQAQAIIAELWEDLRRDLQVIRDALAGRNAGEPDDRDERIRALEAQVAHLQERTVMTEARAAVAEGRIKAVVDVLRRPELPLEVATFDEVGYRLALRDIRSALTRAALD